MKNLQSFEEFLNESLIVEGTMAKNGAKKLYPVDDREETANLVLEVSKLLGVGTKIDSIIQVDEYNEESIGMKIYRYLSSNFKSSSRVDIDDYSIEYDAKLNVAKSTDMADGFEAYFFTENSNF
jgi:hypothetical protein